MWTAGLALLAVCMWRLPRVAPGGAGTGMATAVLAPFSGVALVALGAVVLTETIRSVG